MDDLRILDTWLAGRARPAARRLILLAAAYPQLPADQLAQLPAGRSNLLLLRGQQAQFGAFVDGQADCPQCQERLEVRVELPELLDNVLVASPEPPVESEVSGELTAAGVAVRFRLLRAGDLAAAAECPDAVEAGRLLLHRCVLAAHRDGEPIAPHALPAEVVQALDAALERLDPLADLRLGMRCASCGHEFSLGLDPAAMYWSELAERATRLLVQVHRLATAYGWTEPEILGVPPLRRAAYLELVG